MTWFELVVFFSMPLLVMIEGQNRALRNRPGIATDLSEEHPDGPNSDTVSTSRP